MKALAAALFALALATPAAAAPLSAADARRELAAGAQAWDLRERAGAVIPGAAAVARSTLERWLADRDHAALSRAVSAAGIDLSRDVVLYGVAGDAFGLALHDALARVATGRVHWLVGGIDEWVAAGLPTASTLASPAPVPQHLVARDALPAAGTLAAPALRRGETAAPQRLASTS
ncbi:MAG TPA: rhodanese-like domain-containing protein [Burkholderiaceae bacterium]|nr:rhodanese-like domain-containing protein [Burkholderiaceae bacterium]